MRYWHAIHLERWQSFLSGLGGLVRKQSTGGVPAGLAAPRQPESAPPVEAEPLRPDHSLSGDHPPSPTDPLEQKPVSEAVPAIDAGAARSPGLLHPVADESFPPSSEPSSLSPSVESPPAAAESPAAHAEKSIFTTPAAIIPSPASSMARAFFAAIGWAGGAGGPLAAASIMPTGGARAAAPPPPGAKATAERGPVSGSLSSKAASFFSHLPWAGVAQYGEVIASFRVTADRDFAGLDPRTAELPGGNLLLSGMLSAARTSDRMAAAPAPATSGRARAFFSSIPWAHA